MTTQVLRAATEKIMKDITALLAGIRGEAPPAEPYHPAVARRKARQEARERDGQSITDTPADSGPTDPGAGDVAAGDSSTVDSSTEATPT
jgi:hypothetical protein